MYIKNGLCKEKFLDLLLYCLFILFMILVIGNKKNVHADEVTSYGLANHHEGTHMVFEEGKTYYPSNEVWLNYMTVDNEERFDYGNVWKNQASDVHPPLYYVILHTICSFFPRSFSIWFAGTINILFAVGTLFFFRKLAFLLLEDEKLHRLISIAFISSVGVLSAVSFFRMYVMAMFWVTTLTYLLLRQIEGSGWKFYVALFLCVVGGALTHYYCILYAFFISVAYGILLLYRRAWKETGLFCLTQGIAAVASIGIFPAMLYHIFEGYRGKESFGNLTDNLSRNGFDRIITFLEKLDGQLFGSILVYIAMGAGICLWTFGIQKDQNDLTTEKRIRAERYFCVIIAGALYFLCVSISSPILTHRYMIPIYAVVFLTIFCLVSEWVKKMFAEYYLHGMIFITMIICLNGLKNTDWPFLYLSTEPLLNAAREHSGSDCLFIYAKKTHINQAYYEVSQYHSVTFLSKEHLELLDLMDLASRDELIVTVTGEDLELELLNRIMDRCPSLNTYEYLGGHMGGDMSRGMSMCTNSYYLYWE